MVFVFVGTDALLAPLLSVYTQALLAGSKIIKKSINNLFQTIFFRFCNVILSERPF